MLKRLRKESAEARTSTDPALILTPDPDTLTTWTAHVAGPEDTPFAGGVFELALTVPAQHADRAEIWPAGPDFATYVKRTTHAVQRCKHEQGRRSRGRDWVDARRYPLAPPSLRFVTPVFHPNVHGRTGEVCLDILKEAWSPAWTLASARAAERTSRPSTFATYVRRTAPAVRLCKNQPRRGARTAERRGRRRCTAVRALLAAPNADSPLNCDAGNLIRGGDLAGFEEEARRWVDAHASDGMPERGQAPFPKIAGAADAAPRCPGLATFCVVAVPVVAALIWL